MIPSGNDEQTNIAIEHGHRNGELSHSSGDFP